MRARDLDAGEAAAEAHFAPAATVATGAQMASLLLSLSLSPNSPSSPSPLELAVDSLHS